MLNGISSSLSRSTALAFLLVSGFCGSAMAAIWHVHKTEDAFTGTENIVAKAEGLRGGGFLVKCSEGELHFFLEIPPTVSTTQKNHGLAKELMGTVSVHVPDYRFRADGSGIYSPAVGTWGLRTIIHYHNNRFEEAAPDRPQSSLFPSISARQIISKLIAGNQLIYQIPPQTGAVYKISLASAAKTLLPLIHECDRERVVPEQQGTTPNAENAAALPLPPRVTPVPKSATHQPRVTKNLAPSSRALETLQAHEVTQTLRAEAAPTPAAITSASDSPGESSARALNAAERVRIDAYVRRCWTYDPGAKGVNQFRVLLDVTTDAAGTVRIAKVAPADRARIDANPELRAFAERAINAVLDPRCATLPLPSSMLGEVQHIEVRFAP